MDCPGCNVEMADLEGDGTTVRKCGQCGGLWIDVSLIQQQMRSW